MTNLEQKMLEKIYAGVPFLEILDVRSMARVIRASEISNFTSRHDPFYPIISDSTSKNAGKVMAYFSRGDLPSEVNRGYRDRAGIFEDCMLVILLYNMQHYHKRK